MSGELACKIVLLLLLALAIFSLVVQAVKDIRRAAALRDLQKFSKLIATHFFEQEPVAPYTLTEDERELAARIVAAESRGEGILGQCGVAQVMLDRLLHPDFGFKPSGGAAGIRHIAAEFAAPYEGTVPASCFAAIKLVFDEGWRFTRSPLLYFMNPAKASARGRAWIEANAQPVLQINDHIFYTERKAN